MFDRRRVESEGPFFALTERLRDLMIRCRHSIERLKVDEGGSLVALVWLCDAHGGEFLVRRVLLKDDGLTYERLRYLAEYGNEILNQVSYDDASGKRPMRAGEDVPHEFDEMARYARSAMFRSGSDVIKKSQWSG